MAAIANMSVYDVDDDLISRFLTYVSGNSYVAAILMRTSIHPPNT